MADKQLNINLTPEVAEGIYSNMAIIAHSTSEFIIDFVRMMPGVTQPNVKARVVLAPEHAKRLLFALQDNIAKYENQFGTINLPGQPNKGNTIPMSFGGGEA
jgi:hypothetical protein